MENIVQPNLKGAGFSRASLTGITFSHAAAGGPWALPGPGLAGAGQPRLRAGLAEQRSRARGTEPGRMSSDSPGLGARGQRPGNTFCTELAREWLGWSQRVAVCIRPRRRTLRLERYWWVILNDMVQACTLWEVWWEPLLSFLII